MAKAKKDSPALRLLQLVWDEEGHQMGHSWERLNSAMSMATRLAIEHGLRFEPTDFKTFGERFNMRYWAGNDRHMCGEYFYSLACGATTHQGSRSHGPNRSAAIAFETWKKRKPFIVRVHPRQPARHRIAIGAGFNWYGEWVICTSFSEDGKTLTACSYQDVCRRKITHRTRISHDDIMAYHADIAKRLKAEKVS